MFARRTLILATSAAAAATFNSALANDGCTPHWDEAIGQPGLSGLVYSLQVYNGDLIAGGAFTMAGGQTVNRIARWDGSDWHPFESGGQIGVGELSIHRVRALTVYNGDLIAAGHFATAGGQTVHNIARWDGSDWHPFESGGQVGVSHDVFALAVFDGDLIAGGAFIMAGGQTVNRIARWDGSAWHPLAAGGEAGVFGSVRALTVWNGDLIVGGDFWSTTGDQTVKGIARWDGSQWNPFVVSGNVGMDWHDIPVVHALATFQGDLIAGGSFFAAGGTQADHIARWDGASWHALSSNPFFGQVVGLSGQVVALAVHGDDLIAGGAFFTADETLMVNRIARWDGGAWHALGSGGPVGVSDRIETLAVLQGDLFVGGWFTTAGGLPANRIARWGCPVHVEPQVPVASCSAVPIDFPFVGYETTETGIRVGGGQLGSEIIVLDGSGSSDPADLDLEFHWDVPGDVTLLFGEGISNTPDQPVIIASAPLGLHTVTLTVTNSEGLADTCTITIEVFEQRPVAICDAFPGHGDFQTVEGGIIVECPIGIEDIIFVADGVDPNGLDLIFQWEVVSFPGGNSGCAGGVHIATLTATNLDGFFDTCDITIHVKDSTPPEVMITTDVAALWPPNHAMRDVQVIITASDLCDEPGFIFPITVLVSSNEPDNAPGGSDGNTTGDCHGHDCFTTPLDISGEFVWHPDFGEHGAWIGTIQLRSERAGNGPGRAYALQVIALDSSLNVGTASVVVVVPKAGAPPDN